MDYTPNLKETLKSAYEHAVERRHEYVTLEHTLLAMLDDDPCRRILTAVGANIPTLREGLVAHLRDNFMPVPPGMVLEPEQTQSFNRMFQRAAVHVRAAGRNDMDTSDLLVAMFRETDSHAVYLLRTQGIDKLAVTRFISHGTGDAFAMPHGFDDGTVTQEKTALGTYARNLNEYAQAGHIDPLIGRHKEVERMVQVLCRRRKNNPIMVGDPGVGKTAIVEGLAWRIVNKEVPKVLEEATIYSLDMGAMIAGTKYRGEFEERMKMVLNELKEINDAILFIDEIHMVVGAGATEGGTMDASNLLKPGLQSGEIRCIGSTTHKEYKKAIEKDHALARRFQKIQVDEPSINETYEILQGLKPRYEEHHKISYSDKALRSAAELAGKHINERFLPDKAIDVIDEAGAAIQLLDDADKPTLIDEKHVEDIVARIAKIPPKTVSTDDKSRLQSLEKDLKLLIFGQDPAITKCVDAIKLNRSGLGAPTKPVGSFLFAGPTGVGKTELAKQLALALGVEFIRFDMSEYMEKHSVSKLIGSPPGYVGHDQGGQLVEQVRKHPHSVIVLDEIEKAHPDIYNILLQVMDHASLTDSQGRKADFRNSIIIMTSNAGARDMERSTIGFGGGIETTGANKAIENAFAPEFRNRLDAIVTFAHLSEEVIMMVVDKFIGLLDVDLAAKDITIEFSLEARKWLAERGYDKKLGARPMARLIQNEVRRKLADEILFGKLVDGGQVDVDVKTDGSGLSMKYSQTEPEQKVEPVRIEQE